MRLLRSLVCGSVVCLCMVFPLFPVTIPGPVDTWEQLGPPGGQLQSVLVHPLDPNLNFAGTMTGLWRSADGGDTWNMPGGIKSPGMISDIAVDPKRPDILYITSQFGLYESLDRGLSWGLVTLPFSTGILSAVAIDPANSDTIYLANKSNGIAKSTDRGKSWSQINNGLSEIRAQEVYDLAIDPKDPSNLYIGTGSFAYRSTNGGESWTQSTLGLSSSLPYVFTVAVDPNRTGTVYIGIHGGGVAKSTDGGLNWTKINNGLTLHACDALAIDKQNSSLLYLGNQHGVFKSTDAGMNWAPASGGIPTAYVTDLMINPQNRSVLYAATNNGLYRSLDQAGAWNLLPLPGAPVRTIGVGGPGSPILYAGVYYGGIFKSIDQGKSWVPAGSGITERAVYAGNSSIKSIVVDPKSTTRAYVGIDGGGVYRTTNGGASWSDANNGLTNKKVQALTISPSDSNTLLAGTNSAGVFRTQNGGDSWTPVNSGLNSTNVVSLTFSQLPPGLVYAGTANGVYVSSNLGDSWSDISAGLSRTDVRALAVDSGDSQIVYVGTYSGLDRSLDGGQTWQKVLDEAINSILVDPVQPLVVIAAYTDGRIQRSSNRGLTWEDLMLQGPPVRVNGIAISSLDHRTLFVATEGGSIERFVQERMLSLWFPYYQYEPASSTGFAVSNYSDEVADLTFTRYGLSGSATSFRSNPNHQSVGARSQLANMGHELFQDDPKQSKTAWLHLASNNPQIGSFFQVVGTSQLDGSVAFLGGSSTLFFTRVFEGPTAYRGQAVKTRLSIANIGDDDTQVTLQLMGPGDWRTKTHMVPARGLLFGTLNELFGRPVNSGAGSFIRVSAEDNVPLVGFALIQLDNVATMIGLNAVPDTEATELYSAQLASLPGLFTSLMLVNTGWDTRTATISAINESGLDISPPVTVNIESETAFEADAATIFGWQPSAAAVGSLRIEVDGPGVYGDVVFGDGKSFKYAAALPLQTQLLREAVFSQVANGLGLFTGLAFYNPNLVAAEVILEVYAANGTRTGITTTPIHLEPNSRISRTLQELLPSTSGQIRGYIVVKSTQPMIAQQLFGDLGLNLLSAVPPTIVK